MEESSKQEGAKRAFPFLRRRPELKPTEPVRKLPFTEYLHILETYAVTWDVEKVARDTWQNFFDANDYSVDGVTSSIDQKEDGYKVSLSGPANYDYRYLLHTGGTSKEEDTRAAGGFGEGAKIAALVCLRDLGAKEVVYETDGKRVVFYLDLVADEHYPKPVKGLFVNVSQTRNKGGSTFEATFPFQNVAEVFQKSRDLFYHKDNPDFQNPAVDNEAGGFRIHVGKSGNLYEAGQRRHYHQYNNALNWNNVEDITLWTRGKSFTADRDRGDIDKYQIENKAIKKIVANMETEEIKRIIEQNPPLWHESQVLGLGRSVLREMTKVYKGEPLQFPDNYVSLNLFAPKYIEEALTKAGYILCDHSMSSVGMVSASEKFQKLQEHYRLEPTEAEAKRVNLLKRAVTELLGEEVEEEILLFSKENEGNIIHGQYSTGRIWISQETLHADFAGALASLLHERDHKAGADQSAEFSYALTDTLKKVIDSFLKKADVAKPLAQDWDSVDIESHN